VNSSNRYNVPSNQAGRVAQLAGTGEIDEEEDKLC